MNDDLVAGLLVLAFVGSVMGFVYRLSTRDTRDAARGGPRVQSPEHVRLGLLYHDPEDPRVWVPRPMGNGWDPNVATAGGKAVLAALLGLVLLVVLAVVGSITRPF